MKSFISSIALLAVCGGPLGAAPFDQALYDSKGRTYEPEEALKHIFVPEGYRLELVAAEPMVNEPAVIAWDGNGVMYVAEMSTYMQDIDGKNQHAPVSRVLRLEDTDNDGRMDKWTVFADKLILPRMIQCIDHRVIIRETDTFDLKLYEDTDGDGVADKITTVYEGGRRGGNLEHQPSGLIWNMDNWMYVTYTRKRYRWMHDHIIAEDLPHGSGQFGLTRDDVGRCYFSTGGGERPAMDFQQPLIYGKIDAPGQIENGFNEVFPLVEIPDVQGGGRRYRKNNHTLNHFTGVAGQHVYRGDRLLSDLYGELFIPEPVGRLIRRASVTLEDGMVRLKNATPGTEFIRSDDANFRPVNMATGPDGCLYIVDMYRGIIQEGNWVRRGSYLRGVVEQYGLDKNVQRGRIYRLVHKTTRRGPRPKMLNETSAQLVKHLEHPNGWWRDTAQKLLVVRRDKSAIPALKSLALTSSKPLARLHALWVLEGLNEWDGKLLVEAMRSSDPRLRAGAVRLAEEAVLSGRPEFSGLINVGAGDADASVAIQAALSALRATPDEYEGVIGKARERFPANPLLQSISKSQAGRLAAMRRQSERTALMKTGQLHFETICSACHGMNGLGAPMPDQPGVTLAPSLRGSPRLLSKDKTVPIKIALKGMVGELDGKSYPGPMLPLETYDDTWLAAVLSYARNAFGNKAGAIRGEEVAMVREQVKDRKTMWQSSEILAAMPLPPTEMKRWAFASSHKPDGCSAVVDGDAGSRWDTGAVQRPGMWFSWDMKKPYKLDSIILDSQRSPDDYPREYSVHVSSDGKTWSDPVVAGRGPGPVTQIILPGVETRFVRINQHGRSNHKYWSIHSLEVFGHTVP